MVNGWIKLHREIQDCWIWEDKEPFDKRSAWIDLLITANHSDKKILFNGELITIKRGQILTSVRRLSEKWKWSANKVYRFIKLLESDEMLQKESNKDRTLLTIVNYGFYQHLENSGEYTNGNSDEYTSDTPAETVTEHKQEYKEDKNDKECKEEKKTTKRKKQSTPYYPNDEQLNQAFLDFIEMRNKIKKPMTDRAVTMAMNRLQKLAGTDNDLAINILEQSVLHCWQDLYGLKDDMRNNKGSGGIDWDNV